ncbi:MAG: hypothetical protein QXI16_07260 [Sulfolobaceae archaeon]
MNKSKAIRNIIIYILIIMTCMFFIGFFSAKKAYAAEDYYNKNINAVRSYLLARELDESVIDNFLSRDSFISTMINNPYIVITHSLINNEFNITISESNIICRYDYFKNGELHNLEIFGKLTLNYAIEDNEIITYSGQSYAVVKSISDSLDKSQLFNDDYPSSKSIYYSSHDILYNNTFEYINIFENDVFFLKTTILSPIFRQIPMTGIMGQILSVMMISLGLVVSLTGLHKVLEMLSTILRKA